PRGQHVARRERSCVGQGAEAAPRWRRQAERLEPLRGKDLCGLRRHEQQLPHAFGPLVQTILRVVDCLKTRLSQTETVSTYDRKGVSTMAARRAIVTGASRGIGVHIARALAARGFDLLLVARSEPDLLRVATELRTHGRMIAVAAVDLAELDGPRRVVEAAERELGPVDVLVNNAAIELQRRFHTLDAEEIETVLRVDLIAPIELTRLLLPDMLERGYGRIVNVSSLAGRVGFPYTDAYAAAKDGLIAFSRVLRNDYRKTGVSASAL